MIFRSKFFEIENWVIIVMKGLVLLIIHVSNKYTSRAKQKSSVGYNKRVSEYEIGKKLFDLIVILGILFGIG